MVGPTLVHAGRLGVDVAVGDEAGVAEIGPGGKLAGRVEIRMVELRFAPAANVKSFMDDMVKTSASFRAKGDPDPVFEVIEANNSLMIAAQPGQFAIIEALVKNLDLQQGAERPPLRILRLKATDAASVASMAHSRSPRLPLFQPCLIL